MSELSSGVVLLQRVDKHKKKQARSLRKNMTEAETALWQKIRRKQIEGYQFYRQKAVGPFIVDFYCPSGRLIIEIDGGQHFTKGGIKEDEARDRYLGGLGFAVMRFSNREVLTNMTGVLEVIQRHLVNPPNPPLKKGGKNHLHRR